MGQGVARVQYGGRRTVAVRLGHVGCETEAAVRVSSLSSRAAVCGILVHRWLTGVTANAPLPPRSVCALTLCGRCVKRVRGDDESVLVFRCCCCCCCYVWRRRHESVARPSAGKQPRLLLLLLAASTRLSR